MNDPLKEVLGLGSNIFNFLKQKGKEFLQGISPQVKQAATQAVTAAFPPLAVAQAIPKIGDLISKIKQNPISLPKIGGHVVSGARDILNTPIPRTSLLGKIGTGIESANRFLTTAPIISDIGYKIPSQAGKNIADLTISGAKQIKSGEPSTVLGLKIPGRVAGVGKLALAGLNLTPIGVAGTYASELTEKGTRPVFGEKSPIPSTLGLVAGLLVPGGEAQDAARLTKLSKLAEEAKGFKSAKTFIKTLEEGGRIEEIGNLLKGTKVATIEDFFKAIKGGRGAQDIQTLISRAKQPVEAITEGLGGKEKSVDEIVRTIKSRVTPKLEVGGGKYNLSNLNTPNDIENFIKQTANEISPEIAKARRGTVTFEKTQEAASKIGIEEILGRKVGEAKGDAYQAAASNIVSSLGDDISRIKDSIKKAAETSQPATQLENELTQKVMLLKAVLTSSLGAKTEAGRALNAAKIAAEATLSPQEQLITQVLKNSKEYGNIDLVMKRLVSFAPEDKEGMIKFLAQAKPSDTAQKIEAIYYNNLLSGTATHLANAIGNVSRTLWHLATKPFRVASDIGVSKVTGEPRQEFMKEWLPEAIGATQGIRDGVRKAIFALKEGFREGDVEALRVPDQALKGKIGGAYSLPTRALIAGDELFRGINRTMGIYREATSKAIQEGLSGEAFNARVAELIQNPLPEMLTRADKLATELLYQNITQEMSSVSKIREVGAFNIPKVGRIKPLTFVVPFIQIPYNIAKFAWEASPGGLVTTLLKSGKLDRLEFNRQLASGITGSFTLAGLATLFSEERMTGRAPMGQKEKDAFYAQGKLPYAVKIGDTWVQYNRFPEPIATQLSALASMHDDFQNSPDDPSLSQKLGSLTMGFVRSFADRTFLQGIGDLYNAAEDPERYAGNFIRNTLSSAVVPWSSLSGAVARAFDRTVRQPQTTMDAILAKVPFASFAAPAKESTFEPGGVAIKHTPAFEEFLPIKTSQEITNPLAQNYVENLQATREINALKKGLKEGKLPSGKGGVMAEDATDLGSIIQNSQAKKDLLTKTDAYLEAYYKNPSTKDQIAGEVSKLGVSFDDANYNYISGLDTDTKISYLTNQGLDHTGLITILKSGRKESLGGKVLATSGVIDELVDQSLITKAEGSALKKLKVNQKGETVSTGKSGIYKGGLTKTQYTKGLKVLQDARDEMAKMFGQPPASKSMETLIKESNQSASSKAMKDYVKGITQRVPSSWVDTEFKTPTDLKVNDLIAKNKIPTITGSSEEVRRIIANLRNNGSIGNTPKLSQSFFRVGSA